ncbi:MAG: ribose 5-phosphate isomerase B [Bdellovibrionaceae bacterium]|nr:ribose 5-phosphate isomerase B [Bdellovibrionales bacterium]MCB9083623.1 ribose 5-phosphate isomerase B [Pseudobdellovibrionaceae bacterium]
MDYDLPIMIACDHAGFPLKDHLLKKYPRLQWQDLGTNSEERVDYPDFASRLCEKMREQPGVRGVLVCGSGQGMAMRANKYPWIRAALCWSEETAVLARQHNDANVLCLGSRLLEPSLAEELLRLFLATPFEGGRHSERVEKVSAPVE